MTWQHYERLMSELNMDRRSSLMARGGGGGGVSGAILFVGESFLN